MVAIVVPPFTFTVIPVPVPVMRKLFSAPQSCGVLYCGVVTVAFGTISIQNPPDCSYELAGSKYRQSIETPRWKLGQAKLG